MLRFILFISLLFSCLQIWAQTRPSKGDLTKIRNQNDPNFDPNDSTLVLNRGGKPSDSLEIFIPTIQDYLYKTEDAFTFTPIDTTLTIEKFYAQNFTQKDMFGTMPYPNIGQTFNPLLFQKQNDLKFNLLPTGKSFNYLDAKDVRYFDVKTPITEFILENGVREGQYLSTTFTHSPNEQVNYMLRYRGLRSLGRYQEQLASNLTFLTGLRYTTKNKRFGIHTHYAAQQMDNEESAGILNIEDFTDRDVAGGLESIDVNLIGAQTKYDSRRFRWRMNYGLSKQAREDSTTYFALQLYNTTQYEKEKFEYLDLGTNSEQNDGFYASPTIENLGRRNLKSLENLQNTTSVGFKWGEKLDLETGIRFENIKYYGDTALVAGLINIPERIEDNLLSLIAKANFDWKENIKLQADAQFSQGDALGSNYHLNANIELQPVSGYKINAGTHLSSKFAPLNLVYNQSFYENFNYNNTNFSPVETQKLFGGIDLDKFKVQANASLTNINNYTFLDATARVRQYDDQLNIAKIEAKTQRNYKNWHLNARLAYQKVLNGQEVLPLPEWVGRATVYYQNKAFKDAAEVQIGFNLNYFTQFASREFFPLLNEFKLQGDTPQEIGNFPLFDLFINMKVKRMQIFIRADHIFGAFGKRNYFSAPSTPYRNFKVQFGLRWYLFT